ncbi:hypothetical protein HCJ66_11435 [Listeria sp. FSL L7-1582]|uniref:major tail protein n=1 Tax=Listeria portnoyi TaxID=2713504 RepID=UPI00164E0651|nr:major tail protein [Listeria portnoyi]MBC6310150.1 hypothetical protein [Listeria portnoyi]
MAQTIGFDSVTFAVLDEDGAIVGELLENKGEKETGAVEATIEGITAEMKKVWASNIAVYVAASGTGDVKSKITIFNLLEEQFSSLLGWENVNALKGVLGRGKSSKTPYVAAALQSQAIDGDIIIYGLPKGKFSLNEVAVETGTDESAEPEGYELEGDHSANTDGFTFLKFKGSKEDAAAFLTYLFPKTAPAVE